MQNVKRLGRIAAKFPSEKVREEDGTNKPATSVSKFVNARTGNSNNLVGGRGRGTLGEFLCFNKYSEILVICILWVNRLEQCSGFRTKLPFFD